MMRGRACFLLTCCCALLDVALCDLNWTTIISYPNPSSLSCDANATSQRSALESLYWATDGPNWMVQTAWLTNTSCTTRLGVRLPPHCCWAGIACCANVLPAIDSTLGNDERFLCPAGYDGAVVLIELGNNRLSGPFPVKEIKQLSCFLKYLALQFNVLTGTLPPDMGPLAQMNLMNVAYNKLVGAFPDNLFGSSPVLKTLVLDGNNFTGAIGGRICDANNASLESLSVSGTTFSFLNVHTCTSIVSLVANNVPFEDVKGNFSIFPKLYILRSSNSNLGFVIPNAIGYLSPALGAINVRNNVLVGTIPWSVALFSNLLELDLSSNVLLRGTLPSEIDRLTTLGILDLSYTSVTGTIPESWIWFALTGNTDVNVGNTLLGCCFNAEFSDEQDATPTLVNFTLSNPRLPNFLTFIDESSPVLDAHGINARNIWCPDVTTMGSNASLLFFIIDPLYYMYENCTCSEGYLRQYTPQDPTGVFLVCTRDLSTSRGTGVLVAEIVAPICTAALVLFIVLMWRRVADTRNLSFFSGQVKPPLAGSETTLLVTDIEDSTVLWEASPEVMNAAVVLHHTIVRRCVLQHSGYESATEGDSFILAFHNAPAAVQCAVAVQLELLNCAWPAALYDALPGCARVHVAAPSQSVPPLGNLADALRPQGAPPLLPSMFQWLKPTRFTMASYASGIHLGDARSTLHMSGPNVISQPGSLPATPMPTTPLPNSPSPRAAGTNGANGETHYINMVPTRQGPSPLGPGPPDDGSRPALRTRSGQASCPPTVSVVTSPASRHVQYTVHDYLTRVAPRRPGPDPGTVLLFAGLRVRMGMTTGVDDPDDVAHDRAAGRMSYRGKFMAEAKAVQDAAQGAMVLISERTFEKLRVEELLASHVLVAHMGEHRLKGLVEPMHLYAVVPHTLLPRLALLGPVRSLEQLSSSFLAAPFRRAAIAFMTAAGKDALMAWNKEVAQQSMALYQKTVQDELSRCGGYLVEAPDGLCLAAFGMTKTEAAIRWAVRSVALCLQVLWPTELMNHELGEVVAVSNRRQASITGDVARQAPGMGPQILFRGLRVKCGIDMGEVVADVHAVQGRMTYRGRVMNRAARIGALAKSGQVWCSKAAWEKACASDRHVHDHPSSDGLARTEPSVLYLCSSPRTAGGGTPRGMSSGMSAAQQPYQHAIHGEALGPYRLKGVGEMQLVLCVPQGDILAGPSSDLPSVAPLPPPLLEVRSNHSIRMSEVMASRESNAVDYASAMSNVSFVRLAVMANAAAAHEQRVDEGVEDFQVDKESTSSLSDVASEDEREVE